MGDILAYLKEKFQFLENGRDFPFYNDIPKLSSGEWMLMLIPVILIMIAINTFKIHSQIFPIFFCMVMVIPALYICRQNYGLFFKIPKLRDFVTILACLVGYYVYTIAVVMLLLAFSYGISSNAILESFANPDLFLIISILLQLMGEELFKIFILLFVMHAVYRKTNNRSLSLALGIAFSLFFFAIIHANAYSGRILQILLIQGLGSLFNLYAYMKTKNVVVSYILHVVIDYIPFTFVYLGSSAAIALSVICF